MPTFPYYDASGVNMLSTLGENPITINYLDICGNTHFYPDAETSTVMGPVYIPKIYAKDLDVLEIGSSGQIIMSIQDQASLAFKNNSTNNVTNIEGNNSQSISFQPTDDLKTVTVSHMDINISNNYQRVVTTELLGFNILNPTNLAQNLSILGDAHFQNTLSMNGDSVFNSLSVVGESMIKGGLDVSGSTIFNSTLIVDKSLSLQGPFIVSDELHSVGKSVMKRELDIIGATNLGSSLSIADGVVISDIISVNGTAHIDNTLRTKGVLDVCGSVYLQSSISANDGVFLNTLETKSVLTLRDTVSVNDSVSLNDSASLLDEAKFHTTLNVNDNVFINDIVDVVSTASFGSSTVVRDNTSVLGATYMQGLGVDGPTKLTSSMDIYGSTLARETVAVGSVASFKDTVNIIGETSIKSTLVVEKETFVSEQLIVQNSLQVVGPTNMNKEMFVQNEFKGLTVMNVHDNVFVDKNVTIQGAAQLQSTMIVKDGVNINGSTLLSGPIAVSSSTTMKDVLNIASLTTFANTLSVAGTVALASTLTLEGAGTFNSSVKVTDSVLAGPTAVSNNLVTASSAFMASTIDISGQTKLQSTLLVITDMDACGNVRVGGSLSVGTGASLNGTFILSSTLSVGGTVTLNKSMNTNTLRTFNNTVTLDASKIVINGSIDLIGSINNVVNSTSSLQIQDKLVKLSYDPSGGVIADGVGRNHDSGVEISGLPDGVIQDSSGIYEKSFKWKYDTTRGCDWNNLGKNATNFKVLPKEPSWLLRGGSFKIAQQADESSSVIYTMRVNVMDEFEIWKSVTNNGGISWNHYRTSRFGVDMGLTPISIISEFSVTLGATTRGTTSLSVKINSIFDSLYPNRKVLPIFTVSNLTLIDSSGVEYPAQPLLNFGNFIGNALNSFVAVNPQTITTLSPNKTYVAVKARVSNQYGVTADLISLVNPTSYTLDTEGPQVIGSMSVTPVNLTPSLNVSITSYDVGRSTSTYCGVVFASKSNSVNLDAVDASTSNVNYFTGVGKTSGTADTNLITITRDLSGSLVAAGTYYVYYVLYDPNGNRTQISTPAGPITIITSQVTAFTATLGTPTTGTDRLSLAITGVSDSLYSVNGLLPTYNASNVKLVTLSGIEYAAQIGFNLGSFTAISSGTVSMTAQLVTGLPPDTPFNRVRARIANQYGFYGDLEATISPIKYTYDASGPQIVGSVTTSVSGTTLVVSIVSYDIGASTSTYKGLVLASTNNTLNLTGIDASSTNVYPYNGTGKTAGSPDTNNITVSKDISGNNLAAGIYYVYYVLYDPYGNRTTSTALGPYTIASAGVTNLSSSLTFTHSTSVQSWTAQGTGDIVVTVSGGYGSNTTAKYGYVTARVTVTNGEVYRIAVGSDAGGGNPGKGGGGSSFGRLSTNLWMIVAGGGGGSGTGGAGGNGGVGGVNQGNGAGCGASSGGGGGGTLVSGGNVIGGQSGTGSYANSGGQYRGGGGGGSNNNGGSGGYVALHQDLNSSLVQNVNCGSGGGTMSGSGGCGWWGGSGGNKNSGAGGGGGSSYANPTYCTQLTSVDPGFSCRVILSKAP